MIAEFLSGFAIWRNPVFRRYCRSRLRLKGAIIWYLLAIIIPTFSVALSYILMTNSGIPAESAARRLWISLIVLQGAILMVKGTGVVSAGIIQDKIDQTLDYQRLTPLTPARSLFGYLLGLPVLEYVMFALTLPHLFFIVIVGNIPVLTVLSVYFSFFVCVMLYHMTAIAMGIVMNRWVLGYLLSIFMVIVINLILPISVSQLGLKFMQFLSVWPVISQKVLPVVVPSGLPLNPGGNPFFSMASDVPLYNWMLSPFVFTLLLQSALILTFYRMAFRRWQSATRHSLSKPYSIAFMGGFVVLVIGNVWPAITGQFLPFQIFGQTNLDDLTEVIAVALPGIYALVSWALAGTLMMIVTPSHHAIVSGIRRALKQGRNTPHMWEDESANMLFTSAFVVVVMAGFALLYGELMASGFFEFRVNTELGLWRLPLALMLVLVYTLMLLQVMELKPTVLIILLVWFVPILVSAVLSAWMREAALIQAVIAAISPIALILMAGAVPLIDNVPVNPSDTDQFTYVLQGCTAGLLFVSAQIAYLAFRWRGHVQRFNAVTRV